jgi:outer membrane lipoprotein-sorting protein
MKLTKIIMTLLVFAIGITIQAQENLTGQKIIENVYHRETGEDATSELTMTLINSRDDERVREIKQYSKDFGKEEKSIMFFQAPADVRNTSFMNWSYDEEGKDDDQWIYLPALKKVKRISSDSKSDYFMGSDFTYDDLGDRHPTEDTHKLLREEKLNGEDCYVVESIPKENNYMYSKTVVWVSKDKWIGLKKEFYDEDGDHLKNHRTMMNLKEVKLNTGIDDNMFTERMMKRGI